MLVPVASAVFNAPVGDTAGACVCIYRASLLEGLYNYGIAEETPSLHFHLMRKLLRIRPSV